MKIINKQAFLKMPAGTVFMKFGPGTLPEGESRGGFGDICIKAKTLSADFRYFTLDPAVNCVGECDAIDMADANSTIDVPIEIKHDCRDDDVSSVDQKFAVWSECDVQELKRVLAGDGIDASTNQD